MVMAAELNDDSVDTSVLSVVSYNMHGFYQGLSVMQDLTVNVNDRPDIFLLQEHWLTPANLHKFDDYFSDYFSFGSSAMSKCVQSGVLMGRPFGGVISLVNKKLQHVTETVCCPERYIFTLRLSTCLLTDILVRVFYRKSIYPILTDRDAVWHVGRSGPK